jgi:hypothetical protein
MTLRPPYPERNLEQSARAQFTFLPVNRLNSFGNDQVTSEEDLHESSGKVKHGFAGSDRGETRQDKTSQLFKGARDQGSGGMITS